jgi:hypothetical protein
MVGTKAMRRPERRSRSLQSRIAETVSMISIVE